MNAWPQSLDTLARTWLTGAGRACWQGGVALALVWLVSRLWPRLPARATSSLWRLAYLKLLASFFCATTIDLPLLPALPRPFDREVLRVERASAPMLFHEAQPRVAPARPALPAVATILSGLWVLGLAWHGRRLLRDWRKAELWRRNSTPVREKWLVDHCQELCGRMALSRPPLVLESATVPGPLLLGLCNPAIVLPRALCGGSSCQNVKWMLAHELAHLKRRDLWWMWLPLAGEALFFFHPLIWAVRREWRLTQEVACDELAIRSADAPARDYAAMLLSVAARAPLRLARRGFNAVGIIESKQTLERRLIAMKSVRQKVGWPVVLAATGLLAIGGLGSLPWRAVAQEPVQNQTPADGKTSEAPASRDSAEASPRVREDLEARRNAAEKALKLAQSELDRAKKLVNESAESAEPIEADRLNLAEDKLRLAKIQALRRRRKDRPVEDASQSEPSRPDLKISSPRPGFVEKVYVRIGEKVKKGDPLLALNNQQEKAKLTVAQALLEVAKAQARAAELEAKNAIRAAQNGAGPSGDAEAAEARTAIGRAQVEVARAQFMQAELELNQSTIRAPRDGSILRLSIQEGEFASQPSGSPLIVIGDSDRAAARHEADRHSKPGEDEGLPLTNQRKQ